MKNAASVVDRQTPDIEVESTGTMKALVYHGAGQRAWEDEAEARHPGARRCDCPHHRFDHLRHRPAHPEGRRADGGAGPHSRPRRRRHRRGGRPGCDDLPRRRPRADLLHHGLRHLRLLPAGDVVALPDRRLDSRQHDRRHPGRIRAHSACRHQPVSRAPDPPRGRLVMLSDILPTATSAACSTARSRPGDTVAIVGAGPIGLAALLTAQFYSPAAIIMIDFDDNRLRSRSGFGATAPVNSGDGNAVDHVMRLTRGAGWTSQSRPSACPEHSTSARRLSRRRRPSRTSASTASRSNCTSRNCGIATSR